MSPDEFFPDAESTAVSALTPPPASSMVGKWVFYRDRGGYGRFRIHKTFCQAARGERILELTTSPILTQHPEYREIGAMEIVLVQTLEEEAAQRAPARLASAGLAGCQGRDLPPEVVIGTQPGFYGLNGFEVFDQWCRANHPEYAAAYAMAQTAGLIERDRLRFILSVVTRLSVSLRERLIEASARSGAVVMIAAPRDSASDPSAHV